MLSQEDRDRLAAIAAQLHRDDPRFAAALASGRPRQPREYRRRSTCLLLLTLLPLLTFELLTGNVVIVLIVLAIAAAGPLLERIRMRPAAHSKRE
jgi:hypothetical protein